MHVERCGGDVGAKLEPCWAMLGACGSHVEAMLGHLGPKMGYRRVSCTYNGPFWGHVQHKTLCKIRAFLLKPASMPRWPILRLVEASLCHVGLGSGLVGASRTMLGACSGLVAGHNGQNPCKTAFFVTAQLEAKRVHGETLGVNLGHVETMLGLLGSKMRCDTASYARPRPTSKTAKSC